MSKMTNSLKLSDLVVKECKGAGPHRGLSLGLGHAPNPDPTLTLTLDSDQRLSGVCHHGPALEEVTTAHQPDPNRCLTGRTTLPKSD